MRVLLDENIDRRFGRDIEADFVVGVADHGRSGTKNGKLLSMAAAEFDILIAMDRGIEYQHDLSRVDLAVVVLRSVSSRLTDVLPLVPALNALLPGMRLGQLVELGTYDRSSR